MRIAVFQFAPVLGALEPNLASILAGVDRAAAAGADLFVTPEMGLTGWTLRDAELRAQMAAAMEATALPALAQAAANWRLGIVVGGPLPVPSEPSWAGGRPALANAVLALAPDGSRAVYRKIHLFGEERSWWLTGDRPAVGTIDGVRVGVTICYDGEFPEIPRITRLAGAELIVVPSTNMTPYQADQDLVFATRALENECPVIVANRVGREGDWTYFGRSLIADQRGRIVAQAGSQEELLIADIEPARSGDPALSYLTRRRPEVYRSLVEPYAQSDAAASGAAGR
ncbi:MAG: carbon-nitrogen hydrolase [Anaerolinea sp.]|jgi:predicted amidohydrolase|nr:carbon-nitrogen hydrolase [Anaerolinea sp.]